MTAGQSVGQNSVGMIGLGRMGGNMVRRLLKGGHRCVVYDRNEAQVQALAQEGAVPSKSLDEMISLLSTVQGSPRAVWMMLPAGEVTERTVRELLPRLQAADIIIDGGNSYFKDDVRRARLAREKWIEYMDVGTSGGIWGLERGYCLMIGGSQRAFQQLEPIFKTLAPEAREDKVAGYLHCGNVGSGHFVKMIHNGIEYGMMQAFAEGFDIMKNADSQALPEDHRFDLNLGAIAEVWRQGSVVSSWLLDLIAISLKEDPLLSSYTGFVEDSGEGRWTIEAAIEESVPADVLAASLFTRFRSRQDHTFAEKMLSAMRKQFGGHVERKAS
jgi:6-phosphogluconate dehydrogenase